MEFLASREYAPFKALFSASGCQKCSALCAQRTRIVVDRGNPSAKIMLIGEAPGRNEDLQGKSFVGRAGKILDEVMAGIGLDTNRDIIITSALKCRPPENRRPTREELDNCRPFLLKQIELVNPRVIVLLGATALKALDPQKEFFKMEEEVGRFFSLPTFPGVEFVVFYHPAALIYNRTLKTRMEAHCQLLKKFQNQN